MQQWKSADLAQYSRLWHNGEVPFLHLEWLIQLIWRHLVLFTVCLLCRIISSLMITASWAVKLRCAQFSNRCRHSEGDCFPYLQHRGLSQTRNNVVFIYRTRTKIWPVAEPTWDGGTVRWPWVYVTFLCHCSLLVPSQSESRSPWTTSFPLYIYSFTLKEEAAYPSESQERSVALHGTTSQRQKSSQ
jgi:hypothetical protein